MSRFSHALKGLENRIVHAPFLILGLILLLTLFFASRIPGLKMYSDFADLLPQGHPYIQLHNQIRDTFGGANVVIVGVTVDDGTIFTNDTLGLIHRLTQGVDSLPGVNHNLVSSLTHRTARKVWLTEQGDINSEPYYDPIKHYYTAAELAQMQNDVRANPRIYGLLVSPDLKSALIKGTLNEGALDYRATFDTLQAMRAAEARDGVTIHATGQPALVGWVYSYLGQIMQIFLYTVLIMLALLVAYFRRFYGVLVPLIGITISSIWGLGIISLLGYNLDPLTLVIPFLISARALSHGIQLVERYYYELPNAASAADAARATFDSLFRPGSLGVVSDAIGILLISLGSIPINTKLAYYASLWSISVIVTVLIAVPLILSLLPRPKPLGARDNVLHRLLPAYGASIAKPRVAAVVLAAAVLAYAGGGYLSSWVQIGESEPGSPLLYADHDYNISSKAINESFPGSEELFVIARTDEKGGLKRPEVLQALENFQKFMLSDPELGGAKGVPDLVKQVNRLMHSDDPRWTQIPSDPAYVGGLLFTYMASSPIPGALKEFLNPEETDANLVFYYKDHKGETIRRATYLLKQWINDPANKVEGLSF
ncbi:MAG: transporter, partial [Alphaproteobacteria bacterium]